MKGGARHAALTFEAPLHCVEVPLHCTRSIPLPAVTCPHVCHSWPGTEEDVSLLLVSLPDLYSQLAEALARLFMCELTGCV